VSDPGCPLGAHANGSRPHLHGSAPAATLTTYANSDADRCQHGRSVHNCWPQSRPHHSSLISQRACSHRQTTGCIGPLSLHCLHALWPGSSARLPLKAGATCSRQPPSYQEVILWNSYSAGMIQACLPCIVCTSASYPTEPPYSSPGNAGTWPGARAGRTPQEPTLYLLGCMPPDPSLSLPAHTIYIASVAEAPAGTRAWQHLHCGPCQPLLSWCAAGACDGLLRSSQPDCVLPVTGLPGRTPP